MSPGRETSSEPTLRELEDAADYAACLELQHDTWGRDFSERVPASLLMVAGKTGGVVAGAFDPAGRMLGFVFGITGLCEGGTPCHWSHMLAVRRDARGRGIGRALKRYQRALLLARGVPAAFWTFDPLVAGNAHLNLSRLGAEAVEYVVDMYGRDTGSRLHGSIGTDRLLVRWDLASERTRRALGEEPPAGSGGEPAGSEEAPTLPAALVVDGEGRPRAADPLPEATAVRLPIPPTFPSLIAERPDLAAEWRAASRRVFLAYLARGHRVAGFVRARAERPGGEPAGGCYVLRRASG